MTTMGYDAERHVRPRLQDTHSDTQRTVVMRPGPAAHTNEHMPDLCLLLGAQIDDALSAMPPNERDRTVQSIRDALRSRPASNHTSCNLGALHLPACITDSAYARPRSVTCGPSSTGESPRLPDSEVHLNDEPAGHCRIACHCQKKSAGIGDMAPCSSVSPLITKHELSFSAYTNVAVASPGPYTCHAVHPTLQTCGLVPGWGIRSTPPCLLRAHFCTSIRATVKHCQRVTLVVLPIAHSGPGLSKTPPWKFVLNTRYSRALTETAALSAFAQEIVHGSSILTCDDRCGAHALSTLSQLRMHSARTAYPLQDSCPLCCYAVFKPVRRQAATGSDRVLTSLWRPRNLSRGQPPAQPRSRVPRSCARDGSRLRPMAGMGKWTIPRSATAMNPIGVPWTCLGILQSVVQQAQQDPRLHRPPRPPPPGQPRTRMMLTVARSKEPDLHWRSDHHIQTRPPQPEQARLPPPERQAFFEPGSGPEQRALNARLHPDRAHPWKHPEAYLHLQWGTYQLDPRRPLQAWDPLFGRHLMVRSDRLQTPIPQQHLSGTARQAGTLMASLARRDPPHRARRPLPCPSLTRQRGHHRSLSLLDTEPDRPTACMPGSGHQPVLLVSWEDDPQLQASQHRAPPPLQPSSRKMHGMKQGRRHDDSLCSLWFHVWFSPMTPALFHGAPEPRGRLPHKPWIIASKAWHLLRRWRFRYLRSCTQRKRKHNAVRLWCLHDWVSNAHTAFLFLLLFLLPSLLYSLTHCIPTPYAPAK